MANGFSYNLLKNKNNYDTITKGCKKWKNLLQTIKSPTLIIT